MTEHKFCSVCGHPMVERRTEWSDHVNVFLECSKKKPPLSRQDHDLKYLRSESIPPKFDIATGQRLRD